MHSGSPTPQSSSSAALLRLCCDYCGEEASAVRRVALDADYERLRTPHRERYSCAACFAKKERVRMGLDSG